MKVTELMNIFMDASVFFPLTFPFYRFEEFSVCHFSPTQGLKANILTHFVSSVLLLFCSLLPFLSSSLSLHHIICPSSCLHLFLCLWSVCLPACLLSVFSSPAASPELPPRYLLGQGQRPNTITHVCWYRNQNLSLNDYLRMNQVPLQSKPLQW